MWSAHKHNKSMETYTDHITSGVRVPPSTFSTKPSVLLRWNLATRLLVLIKSQNQMQKPRREAKLWLSHISRTQTCQRLQKQTAGREGSAECQTTRDERWADAEILVWEKSGAAVWKSLTRTKNNSLSVSALRFSRTWFTQAWPSNDA